MIPTMPPQLPSLDTKVGEFAQNRPFNKKINIFPFCNGRAVQSYQLSITPKLFLKKNEFIILLVKNSGKNHPKTRMKTQ